MKFPYIVSKLTEYEASIFKNHFVEADNLFYFEGIWFRNQRPENSAASGYKDKTTARRRYLQFYDAYKTVVKDDITYLAIKDTFIYISNTFTKVEIASYKQKMLNALNASNYTKINKKTYQKDDLIVELKEYDNHPKNIEAGVIFPSNYCSLDVIIHTLGYNCKEHNDRMWTLSTKMFRNIEKRGEPCYINSIEEIEQYLPAQVEMGCGPSIAAGIPPLYEMHETYKVQNHRTGKFYFAEEDDLIVNIINNPQKMYECFSYVPKAIIKSKPTIGYQTFAKLYKMGLFCGAVLNNNFDRLVKRFGIHEHILRIYNKNTYLPKIEFCKEAKSLICIGTHADRRQVQKQARQHGLKVIFIDPEGFYNESGFEAYPIEAPQTEDLILKTTFEEAMESFENKYLKHKKEQCK